MGRLSDTPCLVQLGTPMSPELMSTCDFTRRSVISLKLELQTSQTAAFGQESSLPTSASFAPEHKRFSALNVHFPLDAYPICRLQRR